MKRLRFMGILCLLAIFACGCATTTIINESVCDSIPEGSYSVLCAISGATGISLENVSGILEAANLTGLTVSAYDAQEAMEFIGEIRTYIERAQNGYGLLYSTLMEYLEIKYGMLPAAIQALITISTQVAGIDLSGIQAATQVLSDYDYELLYLHLDKQETIIEGFAQ